MVKNDRTGPRALRRALSLLVALGLVMGVAVAASAHGGDPTLIHACVKSAAPKKGTVLIVDPNQACPSGYTATDWSIAGPPGLVWKGAWDNVSSYVKNDAVESQGSAYVAIAPSTDVQPPDPAYWNLLARQGADGAQGPAGPAGPQGPVGAPGMDRSPPKALTLNVPNPQGSATFQQSVTVGADGLPLIAFRESNDLMIGHCSNTMCSSFTKSAIDLGSTAQFISIAIGADGLGLISYYNFTQKALETAHCSNTLCSSSTIATLDSLGGNFGAGSTSITIGTDGLGLISYYDVVNLDLKVAHCSNTDCSSAATATIDSSGDVGVQNSIAIGADGLGVIAYTDTTNDKIVTAHCSNTLCGSASTTDLDSGLAGPSVAIGVDGLPLISYATNTSSMKVAHCSNEECSAATTATLDPAVAATQTSATIGADGLGLIAYVDPFSPVLKIAHCADLSCSSGSLGSVDSSVVVNEPAITIGVDGLPLISYIDGTNNDLKVAHCPNPLCIPYFRRR